MQDNIAKTKDKLKKMWGEMRNSLSGSSENNLGGSSKNSLSRLMKNKKELRRSERIIKSSDESSEDISSITSLHQKCQITNSLLLLLNNTVNNGDLDKLKSDWGELESDWDKLESDWDKLKTLLTGVKDHMDSTYDSQIDPKWVYDVLITVVKVQKKLQDRPNGRLIRPEVKKLWSQVDDLLQLCHQRYILLCKRLKPTASGEQRHQESEASDVHVTFYHTKLAASRAKETKLKEIIEKMCDCFDQMAPNYNSKYNKPQAIMALEKLKNATSLEEKRQTVVDYVDSALDAVDFALAYEKHFHLFYLLFHLPISMHGENNDFRPCFTITNLSEDHNKLRDIIIKSSMRLVDKIPYGQEDLLYQILARVYACYDLLPNFSLVRSRSRWQWHSWDAVLKKFADKSFDDKRLFIKKLALDCNSIKELAQVSRVAQKELRPLIASSIYEKMREKVEGLKDGKKRKKWGKELQKLRKSYHSKFKEISGQSKTNLTSGRKPTSKRKT